jgi:hypothetical protein
MQRQLDHTEEPERAAMNAYLKIGSITFALLAAQPGQAEELGRLFFTPQQRALLERGQQPNIDSPGHVDSLTVSGIVQKHGGERTVWINGVPQLAGKSDERAPESVPVSIPGQSQPVKVKVGQKVLLGNPPPHKPAENKPLRQTSPESDD